MLADARTETAAKRFWLLHTGAMIKRDFERMHNAIVDALHAIAHFALSLVIGLCEAISTGCRWLKRYLKRSRHHAKLERRTVDRDNENKATAVSAAGKV